MLKHKNVVIVGYYCVLPHLIEKYITKSYSPGINKLIENGLRAGNCLEGRKAALGQARVCKKEVL